MRRVLVCLLFFALFAAVSAKAAPAPVPESDTPEYRFALNLLLLACLENTAAGDLVLGEDACSRAIALNPKSVMAYKLRGYSYLIAHRFERAEADFRIGIALAPMDAELQAGLGQSLSGQGHFRDAVAAFAAAARMEPGNAAYHNGLCWTRAGMGTDLQAALADCNRALVLAPGAPAPLNSRGMVHLRLGQVSAAIADYDAALKAQPRQPSARFGRGLAWLQAAQTAKGVADIQQAREADPEIDDLFVMMGVLPAACAQGKPKTCPLHFPLRGKSQTGRALGTAVSFREGSDADYALAIMAGRLGAMMVQMDMMLGHALYQPPAHYQTQREIEQGIVFLSAHFNLLLPTACTVLKMAPQNCHPYQPALASGDTTRALDDAVSHVAPYWSELCKAKQFDCNME